MLLYATIFQELARNLSRSSNLTALWGYLKEKAYVNKPHKTADSKITLEEKLDHWSHKR